MFTRTLQKQFTWFTNVQHLHLYPFTEHIVEEVVTHSAYKKLGFCSCNCQVWFSATRYLEKFNNKKSFFYFLPCLRQKIKSREIYNFKMMLQAAKNKPILVFPTKLFQLFQYFTNLLRFRPQRTTGNWGCLCPQRGLAGSPYGSQVRTRKRDGAQSRFL